MSVRVNYSLARVQNGGTVVSFTFAGFGMPLDELQKLLPSKSVKLEQPSSPSTSFEMSGKDAPLAYDEILPIFLEFARNQNWDIRLRKG